MAYTAKSAVVSDAGSSPVVFSNRYEKGGNVYKDYDYIASVAATTAGWTYAYTRLPKTASVRDIKIFGAATADGAFDVGLYRVDESTAIDQNCFGTAIAGTTLTIVGGVQGYDVPTVATRDLPLFELFSTAVSTAGATDDAYYDLVLTVETGMTSAATDIGVEVTYVL